DPALRLIHVAHHAIAIEPHGTTEKAVGIEPSQGKIRVGDGGKRPSTEADWTGARSGGLGANMQQASGVEARDRSSAGTGSMDVEHRNRDGDSGDHRLVADARPTGRGIDK